MGNVRVQTKLVTMKDQGLPTWAVVVADQRNSRRNLDLVPAALASLDNQLGDRMVLPFERTAGDEIQGLTRDPGAVVQAMLALTRSPSWHLGIGLGAVQLPLPGSTREARGSAYLAARDAIEQARRSPAHLRLIAAESVSAEPYGENEAARQAEAVLVLLRALVSRRTSEGWEIMDVLDEVGSGQAAARVLNITPSAVSQRASRAARVESELGAEVATALLATAMGVAP